MDSPTGPHSNQPVQRTFRIFGVQLQVTKEIQMAAQIGAIIVLILFIVLIHTIIQNKLRLMRLRKLNLDIGKLSVV